MTDNPTEEWREHEDDMNTSAPVRADQIESSKANDSGSLVEMAEDWYTEISKEEVKIKMIRNYILGVTTDDVGVEEANEIMRAHGFDV